MSSMKDLLGRPQWLLYPILISSQPIVKIYLEKITRRYGKLKFVVL
jgi:hypothetical protein